MFAAKTRKPGKNQGTSHRNPTSTHNYSYSFSSKIKILEADVIVIIEEMLGMAKRFPPPRFPPPPLPPPNHPLPNRPLPNHPPPNHPPPPPPPPRRIQQGEMSGLVIRDFSLSLLEASPNALVNPYDFEVTTAKAEGITDINAHTNKYAESESDGDSDTITNNADADTGGWLASHKRAHQRAVAQCLAAAGIETPPILRLRANVEPARMAADVESCGGSSAEAEAGGVARLVGPSDGERLPKKSFLERCGKALKKKRSFWKKNEDQEE
ncbi:hypothetical protein F4824DRAFT_498098 [Ustulina deusta]|nr:hypothetical protein F4824DRAFT_498098 [Ustulina deusta]